MIRADISTLANTRMIGFSRYDCERSIASVIDGQKITARKVLYYLISRGENAPLVKVSQAASGTAEKTDFHHGDQGIVGVIAGMAQDFVGSNNMNLLVPEGQFGNILSTVPSAGRYIHTKLHSNFRKLFKKEDDDIITYQLSDGLQIEPEFYIPILPVILINGSQGIGTGFASKFLNYNPEDIRQYVIASLSGKKRKPLLPWYRGFKGKIEELETNKFQFTGDLEIVNSTTIRITELPIGMYLDDIIKVLNKLKESDFIKDYNDDSITTEYNITVTVPRTTAYLEKSVLLDKFKLVSRDSQNLTAWLHTGKIRKFATVEDVIEYFIGYRLEKYEQRRLHQLETMRHDQDVLMNKIRFIEYYLENSAAIAKKNKKELVASLEEMGFSFIDKLLDIKIYNLTADAIEAMENQLIDLDDEIGRLDGTTAKDMYLKELQDLKLEG